MSISISPKQALAAVAVIGVLVAGKLALGTRPTARGKANRDTSDGWYAFAAQLDNEAAAAAAAAHLPIVFLGDSITESFRGTSRNGPCQRCQGTREMFEKAMVPYGAPVVQGISGDQTSDLLHRLEQPGLRRLLRTANLAVVHIGTNDLSHLIPTADWKRPSLGLRHTDASVARIGSELAGRVAAVVATVRRHLRQGAAVLLVPLLPRGTVFRRPADWPNDVFAPLVAATNARLREAYAADPAVTVVDCVPAFEAVAERGVIPARFMPDGLHPSALGHRDLVLPQLREAMDKSLLAAAAAAPSVAAPDPPEGNWGPCVEQCDRPPGWFDLAALLDREAAAAAAAAEGDPAAPRPVVFLGDSIFEAFRGTHVGAACGPCAGTPRVFRDAVAPYGAPAAQGIAGDQTGHLLHRLRQPGLRRLLRAAATAVVHIGTNDLTQMVRGGAVDGDALARRVAAVVSGVQAELGKSGAAPPLVVVVGLLPRSSGNGSPAAWPNDAYTPPILDTNARLREAYAADPAVTVVDCVPAFEAVAERGVIPARFMPDGLHPSALGHRDLVLAQVRPVLERRAKP